MNIYEIAKLANVSISSVSRVVNNQPGVRHEIRRKIQSIIAEHDYRPNLLAQELTTKKTNVIGVIIANINSYYAESIEAVYKVCQENNYSIMIAARSSSKSSVDQEVENFHLLSEKQVDGIIFFVSNVTEKYMPVLKKITKRTPIVVIGHEFDGIRLPCVLQDNYNGAKKAVEHLIENGHKRIAFIGGPEQGVGTESRYMAYKDALHENGLHIEDNYIRKGSFGKKSGYIEMSRLLAMVSVLPTALFVANDDMAIGAMKAIREKGLKIPNDISVVGFDDIEMASYLNPPLTTVRQEQYETGIQGAQMLIEAINSKKLKIKKVIMGQELIIRNSTRRM